MLVVATSGLVAFSGSAPARSSCAVAQGNVCMTGVSRNANIGKLQAGYLFPEIGRRRNAFLEKNPDANIISLGIGDTTQPVPPVILEGLKIGASKLGTKEGYTGYGPEQGVGALRSKIAETLYDGKIAPEEVFVSDGSKCDIGRLQMMFGSAVTSAVQVRARPRAYSDGAVAPGCSLCPHLCTRLCRTRHTPSMWTRRSSWGRRER
jgi:LL-diaminopimelate aminotransferase